ncbi:sodium/proton antiporter, CPA1 family (TC 2.A.36) [Saccharopolyspora kobensis]|uniref:Sodium/proton antiporter, CPA1 family n=1 Tax=Saccharopolyspora kobensis TaxID=146035 RepID=A0A1H6C7Y1_9PSEU|nr:Na+/H+ antiporter [Saccharopolyspora kobensis]SEG69012.1 sodium/proton antiporter, CPA1 family (TC 2.A.36) [Saccharopolyspora kobensis]SFC31494.1 sodium/proton antiporter, CPA1 family [Saccharopolyspora kobensis]
MHDLPALMALLAGSLGVTAVARRIGLSAPLALVVVGLAVSSIPGVPDYALDPDVVLLLILPPLLYSAALNSSTIGIRANLRPIGLLAFGLVLFTTAVAGAIAWWLVPDLPVSAALVLGAVLAPPDAVAAISIGRRLGLPRKIMTVLSGESLVNDATALTAYRVAVAAAVGVGSSLLGGVGMFLIATVGGVVIGYAIGWLVQRIRRLLRDDLLESATGLIVPFFAYLLAEEVGASGVLAVVVAGLYLGHHATSGSAATRLQDRAVWSAADTLLEAVVFALIGLQLRNVAESVSLDLGPLLVAGLALTAGVVLARVVWVFLVMYLPELLRGRRPSWRDKVVVSWAGMRGVVSLAAASAIPTATLSGEPFPHRSEVLFLTFFVTLATLLLHGSTLPWLINKLDVRGTEDYTDALAEAEAQHNAARAARERLDELAAESALPENAVEQLRSAAQQRSNQAWERLGRSSDEVGESPTAAYRRLRGEMLAAERAVFVQFRDNRRIDDEVLRRVMHQLDLEELWLSRD